MTTERTTHFTPMHLQIMLHAYTSNEALPNNEASAVVEYAQNLVDLGLIHKSVGHFCYCATEKGKSFVALMCQTPMPEQVWASNGKVIEIGWRPLRPKSKNA